MLCISLLSINQSNETKMLNKPKAYVALLMVGNLLDILVDFIRTSQGNCVASHKLTTLV